MSNLLKDTGEKVKRIILVMQDIVETYEENEFESEKERFIYGKAVDVLHNADKLLEYIREINNV